MRVLVAVDGSRGAQEAVKALAHLRSCEQVMLLNVLDVPSLKYESVWFRMKDLPEMVEGEMRKEAEELLDRVSEELGREVGAISRRIEQGDPAAVILDMAAAEKVDLIVLGARGLNRMSELVFGSVSHRVLSHAPCSTLIVKVPLAHLSNVLVPVQGAEDANGVTDFLTRKPFATLPHITVLHAVPFAHPHWLEGAMIPETYRNQLLVAGESLVNQTAAGLASLGYEADPLLLDGPPAELIMKTVREQSPDLIIVGSHGRKGLSRFVLGSVSHAVVHRAPCSVLVLR